MMRTPKTITASCLLVVLLAATALAVPQGKTPQNESLTERQKIVHLLSRLSFGVTPQLVAEVEQMGREAWLDAQLTHTSPSGNSLKTALSGLKTVGLSLPEIIQTYVNIPRPEDETREQRRRRERMRRLPGTELRKSVVLRGVLSDGQVAEVMAEFWRNHFNVDLAKGSVNYTGPAYEEEVVRQHLFSKFHDMLSASAHHPAMLVYLDNVVSRNPPTKTELKAVARRVRRQTGSRERGEEAQRIAEQRGLNENYARELMELHTLGVDNGYKQKDVIAVAEALTGWTVANHKFSYRDDMHVHKHKFVLGKTVPRQKRRNGVVEGENILLLLAHHKNTSDYLAQKLCIYLVNDEPSPALLRSVARRLRKTRFDLGDIVKFIALSEEFSNPDNFRAKFKTPVEFCLSALRATHAEITDPSAVISRIQEMGQPIYGCEDPTGYRDTAESWRDPGVMAVRWRFAIDLAQNKLSGVRVPDEFYASLKGKAPSETVTLVSESVLPGGLEDRTFNVLFRVARRHGEDAEPKKNVDDKAKSASERLKRRWRRRALKGSAKSKKAVVPLEQILLAVVLGSPEFQEQ